MNKYLKTLIVASVIPLIIYGMVILIDLISQLMYTTDLFTYIIVVLLLSIIIYPLFTNNSATPSHTSEEDDPHGRIYKIERLSHEDTKMICLALIKMDDNNNPRWMNRRLELIDIIDSTTNTRRVGR